MSTARALTRRVADEALVPRLWRPRPVVRRGPACKPARTLTLRFGTDVASAMARRRTMNDSDCPFFCRPARPILRRPSVRETSAIRRRVAILFVDIAGSTSLLMHHPPAVVLGVVQGSMTLVTAMASGHAGTVKDFEGDGALLYFASTKNAVRAALAIQRRLAEGRWDMACGEGPGIAARMSITVGDVVVGTGDGLGRELPSARRGVCRAGRGRSNRCDLRRPAGLCGADDRWGRSVSRTG